MNIYTSTKVLPYVYRLDHPVTGEFYIGYRSANKTPSSEDLGILYFTSSKEASRRFNEFTITIIAEFFKKEDAYIFEQQLIHENWSNLLKLNKRCFHGSNNFFVVVGPKSDITKNKIRIAALNSPHNHFIHHQFGENNVMSRFRGEAHWYFGTKRTEEVCRKISENHHDVSASKNPRARKIKITFPNGTEHICFGTFKTFCAENDLPFSTMCKILRQQTMVVKGKCVDFKVEHIFG